MPIVKLTLSEEYYEKLVDMASDEKKSVQDFIRDKIFEEKTIFTPEEAAKRAFAKFDKETIFTLPDIYGEEWTLERGPAGVFGKAFYNYTQDYDCGIKFVDMGPGGRRARYSFK